MTSCLGGFSAGPEDLRKHGSPFPFDVKCMPLPRQAADSIKALNHLAGIKFDNFSQPPCRPPTKVQNLMVQHVQTCLDENGGPPDALNGKSALAELTRSFTPYEGTPNHLADYDFDKVKILRSTVRPKDVVGLLPEKLKPLVENFRQHVVRDPMQIQTELDADPTAMPKIPYWDPKLKNDTQLRHQLF